MAKAMKRRQQKPQELMTEGAQSLPQDARTYDSNSLGKHMKRSSSVKS